MNSKLLMVALGLCQILSGCATHASKLLAGPELSPVGAGMTTTSTSPVLSEVFEQRNREDAGSWVSGPGDYFRDQRAGRRGDLITVKINLNDRATFNNSSTRTRKAQANANATFDVGMWGFVGQGTGEADAGSNSTASGQGTISRSERLSVSLTAVVRKVFPNGTLYIEGSQETMVNFERRDIKISGIIHPRDIGSDNSVDFGKIAEARVVYGGAGKVSDVQKPGWGLQLWDKINPF